jgi:hypothetical protein
MGTPSVARKRCPGPPQTVSLTPKCSRASLGILRGSFSGKSIGADIRTSHRGVVYGGTAPGLGSLFRVHPAQEKFNPTDVDETLPHSSWKAHR